MTNHDQKPIEYLSISEQSDVRSKLHEVVATTPLKELLFYNHGDKFAWATLFASNLLFWRCGFRGFNLNRYNRFRLASLTSSSLLTINATLFHTFLVRNSLTDFYRSESQWTYGFKSLFAHQLGLLIVFLGGTGFTFIGAQYIATIPAPPGFSRDALGKSFHQYYTRLRPYSRSMATTVVLSSTCMFMIGLLEYKQSRSLLAKINRKTLSLKED